MCSSGNKVMLHFSWWPWMWRTNCPRSSLEKCCFEECRMFAMSFFSPSSFVQQKRMQVERTCCAFQWVSSQCIGKSLDSSYFLHLLDHVCLFVLQMWAATKWVRGWDEGWFIYLKKLYIDIYRYITDWYFSMFLNCNPLFRSNVFLLHPAPRLQAPAK